MSPDDVKLSAVNWQYEMEVTPDHFIRQERYFDSALLWTLRYATVGFGLVGGGPRLPAGEHGAVRHDPIMVIHDDEKYLNVSVTQCRGLTPAGCMIDIVNEHPVHHSFAKDQLAGVTEAIVYVIGQPHKKHESEGSPDDANPQMKSDRRPTYELTLQPRAETLPYGIAVGRLRKLQVGTRFEKDPQFIPACISMVSYSELAASGRKILDETNALMERYIELNRAMREYLVLFEERGIDTENDVDALAFVERMVVALQNCVYGILDPTLSPRSFFAQVRKLFHGAAVHLDLSPPVQQYFDLFSQAGETEFVSLILRQKKTLDITPRWEVDDDLAVEVREALQGLNELRRLERALEGKYIDFRISPMLESMNFIFDRGGRALYKFAYKPVAAGPQGSYFVIRFAQMRLQGSGAYRLILVGTSTFPKGTRINVGIRTNQASGFADPVSDQEPGQGSDWKICEAVLNDQRNFELDIEASDVPVISDLRVSVPLDHPIRTALVFTRHRFFSGRQDTPASPPLRPEGPPVPRQRFQDTEPRPPAPGSRPRNNFDPPPLPPRRNRLG